ncbi:MAG: hypothetical protein U0797_29610 [Gemmataceae bacterium]
METPLPIRRAALTGRGRVALLWGAALFLLAQVGLNLILVTSWPVRDPEYGRRLAALRQRLLERGPGRPLTLLIGSSRVAMNVRPGLMEVNQTRGGPTVFNFGLCRAGPMLQLRCLRRLLDDGVRPDLVLAELHYALLPWAQGEGGAVGLERLGWSDVQAMAPEFERPGRLRRQWVRAHAAPWYGLNSHLMAQWAPSLLDDEARRKCDEWGVDEWGWLAVPSFREDNPMLPLSARRSILDHLSAAFVPVAGGFRVSDPSRRLLAEMAALCRREGIGVAFLLQPDVFLPRYPPATDRHLDNNYGSIARECGVPVIDLRDGAAADDFVDGSHMTDVGAARYTAVFEAELRPVFKGQPVEDGWPAGQVRPTAEARRRLAERQAGGRTTGHVRSR